MLKNIILTTLICISAFVSEGIFYPAAATASNPDNPKKYIFLFFIQGLNDTDLNGSSLPNMKKLKSEGISYQHVTKTVPANEQAEFTTILGLRDNHLQLTRALQDNNIDCIAVDGTETITASLAKKNRLELITEKNDQLALDKFFHKITEQPYQFAAIHLDDASSKDQSKNFSESFKWSMADNQVGRVINHLIRTDKLANSTIIITGGGITPPLVIFNGGNNQPESFHHCRQLDIAPTICQIFDIIAPTDMPGHILYEVLTPTNSKSLTNNLKHRINDLQKECRQYNQQISLYEKEQQFVQIQKADLKEKREILHKIVSEKDSTIQRLNIQISILKLFGTIIFIILLTGYIFQYRWLRKKFLIF